MFIHKCFHHAGESGMFEILQLKSADIDQPPSLWIATCESNPPKSPCFMHRLGRKKSMSNAGYLLLSKSYYIINWLVGFCLWKNHALQEWQVNFSARRTAQQTQGLLGCLRRQAIGFFSVGRRPCDIAKGNLKQVSSSIVSKRKNP